jgi:hypothetical protein
MNKEQLSQLSDDVRIPTEILLERLKTLTDLPVRKTATSDEGGVAFFFSEPREDGLLLTADIEIYADGSISASVIPYLMTNEGLDVFQSEEEPIELWDIEEEPPFEETIRHISERLGLVK